jgi:deoxyribose-phosphate aldolase
MVGPAARALQGTGVGVCTVVGFPLGFSTLETKAHEAKELATAGATELDVVWNLQAFKTGDYAYIRNELATLMQVAQPRRCVLKVIIETSQLDERELRAAAQLCAQCGVHFVKTSTGFNGEGAQLAQVRLLRQWLPAGVAIKASGGIRTPEAAAEFLAAGAQRIGTSARL